ncbi:MAG: serine hydrolase [Muribaculaceae bacterium]|nr:serine hydrolase [Muribaculaceae bacterium]
MKKRFLSIIIAMLSITCSINAKTTLLIERSDSIERNRWVDSVYSSLSNRQRVAQLFIPMIGPSSNKAMAAISREVEKNEVGGLLFSRGSVEQYATLINHAQSITNVPLMITLDGEWGLAMRMKETPRYPYNMGLGAIKDETLLYNYGREIARQCKAMGIHVNFAPVLDVNSNPANPVIGYRSFGEDPERVSRLGIAYSLGLEGGGVMSVSKHFPGHGDTSVDSHDSLPTIYHSQAKMREVDLVPFESYIESGLSGIMVGHLSVPAYDNSSTPASLSRKITTTLLKEQMGFDGLVFTDALTMKGAQSGGNICIEALRAGADVLLDPGDISHNITAIINAANSGRISWSDIEIRCKKMLAYKYALKCHQHQPIDLNNINGELNSPEADAVNRALAAGSITAVFNRDNLLPIKNLTQSIAVVNIGTDTDETFTEFCSKYARINRYSTASRSFTTSELSEIKSHDIVIVAVYDDKQWARNVYAQLRNCENLIPVFFTTAYRTNKFRSYLKDVPTLLLAYDDTPYTREYAAQAIFGGIDVSGRLPVNLNGLAPIGSGVDIQKTRLGYSTPMMSGVNSWATDSIDFIINKGLENGAFPGCQLIVAKHGNIIIDRCYGNLSFDGETPVSTGTLYDLASVSKATGTLPGVMKAFDLKLFRLDSPASFFIPGLRNGNKADITVRELLYHESGMPASINMFNLMMDTATYEKPLFKRQQSSLYSIFIENSVYGNNQAQMRRDITSPIATSQFNIEAAKGLYVGSATLDTIRGRIYDAKLRRNKKYNYSCLNFCLLMEMEERLTGISHDRWVNDSIFAPLGAYHTCYRPLSSGWSVGDIAPTENDQFLRRQTLQGYVHDEIANFSGGVQGNAGLFSNATDLAKLCQMWLNGGTYGGVRILSEETVSLFTTDKSPNCRRGLGFDKPDMTDPDKSPTAEEASAATFGHIGFTGTCFWVDPESELIYIFLCNRVNPTRSNKAFSDLNPRPTILSLIYRAMTENTPNTAIE